MCALLFVEVHSQLLLVLPFGSGRLLVAGGVVGVVSCCLFFFVCRLVVVGVVCGTIEVRQ